ncbi:signal transducing adapter molecule 2-like isoform X2 [Convolutriloba macropyga]|uniref:signal transducing adapter molecule 2-like isoform X2 n=1 Tax=Convolutriloba macropyga TaxID=536237 RepID=UPI003F52253B
MPLFGSQASPLEADIEKATAESLVAENWALNFEICDKLNSSGDKGCKEGVKIMLKRLLHKNPRVVYHTLVLMETCGKNCGREFLLNVSTREFCQEIQSLLNKMEFLYKEGQQVKIRNKLLFLVESWHKQYGSDPQFGMISELYTKLKEDPTVVFPDAATLASDAATSTSSLISSPVTSSDHQQTNSHTSSKHSSSRSHRSSNMTSSGGGRSTAREEDDLAKAIALSLKDSSQTNTAPQTIASAPAASYGTNVLSVGSTNLDKVAQLGAPGESRKVRAMYDFEAVESNELTFKAGELIILQDDSDENWWKGENHRGTGLFPAHFVTKDLDASVPGDEDNDLASNNKKSASGSSVAFQDEVKVIEYSTTESGDGSGSAVPGGASVIAAVEINAEKIGTVQQFLDTADPTGLVPDPPEMLAIEHECYAMGPLIDEQLHQLDLEHVKLTELNKKVIDALNMYHKLMEQSPAAAAPLGFQTTPMAQQTPGMYGVHPPQPGTMMMLPNGQPAYPPQMGAYPPFAPPTAGMTQQMGGTMPNSTTQPDASSDVASAKQSVHTMGGISQGDYGAAQANGSIPANATMGQNVPSMTASPNQYMPVNGSLPPPPQSQQIPPNSAAATQPYANSNVPHSMNYQQPQPSNPQQHLLTNPDPTSLGYNGAAPQYTQNAGYV